MYSRDEEQHLFLVSVFGEYDESYVPILGGYWSDYSGCAWMIILERGGQYYVQEYCYSPEANNNEPEWGPHPVTYDRAIEILLDWEDHLE